MDGTARVSLYVDRPTVLHRLHPRVKLALLAATFLSAYSMERPVALVPIAALVAGLFFVAEATANVRRLAPLFLAVPIATFTIWCFFYGAGEPLPVVGRLGVTREAVVYGAGMALKLETFFASSILFLSITRVEEFTEGLRGLGLPDRVSFTIALAFRLVPLFLTSALTIIAAQQSRGLDLSKGSLSHRLRLYVPVIVPVFMGALRRADSMAIALEARGFGAARPRTRFVRSRLTASDAAAAALILGVVGGYLFVWWNGWGRMAP